MKEMHIRLRSFQDVRELCSLAAEVKGDVRLSDGKRMVNAKSIMCMFGLHLWHRLMLQLDCSEEDFEAFRQKAGRFEVK